MEAARRSAGTLPAAPSNGKRPARRTRAPVKAGSQRHHLMQMALGAFLVAKDAAANLREALARPSGLAFLAIKECEKELDQLERAIDEEIPRALAQVSENDAREILASLKLIIDLERIGDLVLWVAMRLQRSHPRLPKPDTRLLAEMSQVLESLLGQLHEGFLQRDLESARTVVQADNRLDEMRHSAFRRHLEGRDPQDTSRRIDVLLMAQALERAGDHGKNLAEELFYLVEGRSLRHVTARQRQTEFELARNVR
jgi:phosphate transport system protein